MVREGIGMCPLPKEAFSWQAGRIFFEAGLAICFAALPLRRWWAHRVIFNKFDTIWPLRKYW